MIAPGTALREGIEKGTSLDEIERSWQPGLTAFASRREVHLLY